MSFLIKTLDFPENLFPMLSKNLFEPVVEGRKALNLIRIKDDLYPLVRTTTRYQNPALPFEEIHETIINKIKEQFLDLSLDFNNAMVEIYNNLYTSMGYHSDQALDLDKDSYIAIFSVYNNQKYVPRTLMIQNKITKNISKIVMEHNSVILFSVKENAKHLHKIILEKNSKDTEWLGITFRLSKTMIKFIDNKPYFLNGEELILKNDKEFYHLRTKENKEIEFEYPPLNYTISPSDLLF